MHKKILGSFLAILAVLVALPNISRAAPPNDWVLNSIVPEHVAQKKSIPVKASFTSPSKGSYRLDIEILNSSSARVTKATYYNQYFKAGQTKNFYLQWQNNKLAVPGDYSLRLSVYQAGTNSILAQSTVDNFTIDAAVTATWKTSATATNVTLGQATSIKANVTAAQKGKYLVDVEIYDSNGQKVVQKYFDSQGFSAGQTKTFSYSWTAKSVGTYTVKIGVFNPNWNGMLAWNDTAANFTVSQNQTTPPPTPGSWTLTATVPSSLNIGDSANINTTAVAPSAGTYLIDVEVYNGSGAKVGQKWFDNETFAAGQSKSYTFSFATAGLSAGTYAVKLGSFNSGWGTNYSWNDAAASFVLNSSNTTPLPTPVPGPTTTPNPPPTPTTTSGVITMAVDLNASRHPISPFIYGTNESNKLAQYNLTMGRIGGNRWTAYNWENNASNAGTDWYNQNDGYLSTSNVPGEAVRAAVQTAQDANAAELITVPIQGYVAADKNGGGDVNQTPNYLTTRFFRSLPTKGSTLSLTPNTTDTYVYQDEFVNWLENKFPNAKTETIKKIFYSLDNEPDLWSSTHPRIEPQPVTYAELLKKTIDFSRAIKDNAAAGLVFGPVSYGFNGFVNLQSASDANGRNFLDFYLSSMKSAEQTYGKRLVDVLDLHWYPEAQGGGVRITGNDITSAVVAARLQAPRSLWDTTYRESSWVANYLNGPVKLLPTIQSQINTNYPGTKLAFTEYNYGGTTHISGGIAEADVLGIFGRDNVFAASFWPSTSNDSFVYGGMRMYRNFDGAKGTFGDTSVSASTSDTVNSSIYASVDSANTNRAVFVLINKKSTNQTTQVSIKNGLGFTSGTAYTLSGTNATPQPAGAVAISNDSFSFNMPAYSVTTIVLTK